MAYSNRILLPVACRLKPENKKKSSFILKFYFKLECFVFYFISLQLCVQLGLGHESISTEWNVI